MGEPDSDTLIIRPVEWLERPNFYANKQTSFEKDRGTCGSNGTEDPESKSESNGQQPQPITSLQYCRNIDDYSKSRVDSQKLFGEKGEPPRISEWTPQSGRRKMSLSNASPHSHQKHRCDKASSNSRHHTAVISRSSGGSACRSRAAEGEAEGSPRFALQRVTTEQPVSPNSSRVSTSEQLDRQQHHKWWTSNVKAALSGRSSFRNPLLHNMEIEAVPPSKAKGYAVHAVDRQKVSALKHFDFSSQNARAAGENHHPHVLLQELYAGLIGVQAVFIYTDFVFGNFSGGILCCFGFLAALYSHFERQSSSYYLTAVIYSMITLLQVLAISISVAGFRSYHANRALQAICMGAIPIGLAFAALNVYFAREERREKTFGAFFSAAEQQQRQQQKQPQQQRQSKGF